MPGIEGPQRMEEEVNGRANADVAGKSEPLKEAKDRPNRILRYAEV